MRRALSTLLLITGCSKSESVTVTAESAPKPGVKMTDMETGKEIPADELSPEIRADIAKVSADQAAGFEGGSIKIDKAWLYKGTIDFAAEGAKTVAIEFTLTLAKDSHFDLDDIDIIDAGDDKNYGSDPHLQRLTDKGEAADWEDPVFPENGPMHMVGLWAVPSSTKAVKLGYWGQTITQAIPIGTVEGHGIPDVKRGEPSAYANVGKTKTGETRHVVLLDCFCSRTDRPPDYQIVDSKGELRYALKIVEVDEKLAPLGKAELPYYGHRQWVVELWADAKAHELNQYGKHSPLPAKKLELSKPMLAALDAAPLDKEGVEMNAYNDKKKSGD